MSLFRTAARATVATRVIGNTHRRQQQRWAAQELDSGHAAPIAPTEVPSTAPAPTVVPTNSAPDMSLAIEQLTRLGQLRDTGVLTETEFELQKQKVLAG